MMCSSPHILPELTEYLGHSGYTVGFGWETERVTSILLGLVNIKISWLLLEAVCL